MAIIVGSGIAGIASAIRLQNKGYKVQILEKNLIPGLTVQQKWF
jgi:phytoene dehydrogenase-like protein